MICGSRMYDAPGGPSCQRRAGFLHRTHSWGLDLGDGVRHTETWEFTMCWQFHDEAQRASGWRCTEPVGHPVT